MNKLFWNASEILVGLSEILVSLSAPLQICLFFGIWLGLWLPLALPLAIALKWHPPRPLTTPQKLPLLASLYLIAPPVLWLFSGDFAIYGLPWQGVVVVSLWQGILGGGLGLAILFGVEWSWGWVERRSPVSALLPTLISTLCLGVWVSLTEELIFRGFLLNQLQANFSPWGAAAIASLIFAVLHLVWEGQDNIPQLPGLWLMGMVLVLARWVDGGNLGLAWGLHAGWVWAIATLDTTQVLAPTSKVPAWVTGWAGKPLAGMMGILFLVGTGAVLGFVGQMP